MTIKRYAQHDPAIEGSEVVLASDFDRLQLELSNTRAETLALKSAGEQQANRVEELEAELAAVRNLSTALDSDAALDQRMIAAGMYSVAQVLAGKPLDAFIRHAGVTDLSTYQQWLDMKRAGFVKLQARLELASREDDELYEWAMSHAAAFAEVAINFRAACHQGQHEAGAEPHVSPAERSQLH
ncbi:hypothetical protein NPS53_09245 [Pseudomonas putida]|uniref:hypothetical protein n=1 Tax=Pseudomonas putida TaxID=303 RepID=UPI002364893E|nr:hypothetical protein [Pseudomonas putida]MDD2139761.1 hypothetical protein [Pseudomonas putida]HDS1721685.1 hypothetical protein [Pseudomonas putida]